MIYALFILGLRQGMVLVQLLWLHNTPALRQTVGRHASLWDVDTSYVCALALC
jgi:hypothetical protein